ncbi:MAG TPA: hypothetical protein EYH36_08905 [Desulfocapsa sulfexigens]|nr:hypothetical protein [Desulfocapsa sulfexigens]
MNWCELGSDRTEEVLNSYISASSFSGNHIEAHAIKITTVEEAELKQNDSEGISLLVHRVMPWNL